MPKFTTMVPITDDEYFEHMTKPGSNAHNLMIQIERKKQEMWKANEWPFSSLDGKQTNRFWFECIYQIASLSFFVAAFRSDSTKQTVEVKQKLLLLLVVCFAWMNDLQE